MTATSGEQADAAANAFEAAFLGRGYEVVRRSAASNAEGTGGDYLRGEVSAYQGGRPQTQMKWSLVRIDAGAAVSEEDDALRRVIQSVESPLPVVILSGEVGAEILSIVVSV